MTTGLRFTWEDRENSTYSNIADNGFGASLNPVSVNGVQTGGFATTSTGTLAAGNSASQLSLADSVAAQYFGVKATSVAGAAYKSLTAAEQLQVATAQKLRATNIGVLVAPEALGITEAHLPTVLFSPSYKFNDNYTTYVSFEYNQKAGIAEFINGVPNVVQPERTSSYEWGLKTLLPNQKLTLNADLFLTNINDYQQAIEVENLYTTNLNNNGLISYTSATGSAPRVRAEGLEVDAVYGGIKNTTLRFAGAYNNAHYVYFPNSAQPVENGNLTAPYRDVSGQQLPGNSKLNFNLGGDYRLSVWNGKWFHTSWNTMYETRFNADPALSNYAWVPAHSVTDWGVGIANAKQTFDVSLIAKNLFNNSTPQAITWDTYTPAIQRWLGIQFSGKL